MPSFFVVARFRQGDCPAHKASQGIGLRQRLPVELVDPSLRTVGTHHYHGQVLIVGLGYGGRKIEQGRAAGDAYHDWLVERLCHAYGIEARAALVGDRMALDVWTLVQVVDNGSIAAAWAYYCVAYAVTHEQGREYVGVLLVAIQCLILNAKYLILNSNS